MFAVVITIMPWTDVRKAEDVNCKGKVSELKG